MLSRLRSFLGRYSVIELVGSLVVALAVVDFVRGVTQDWIYTPITEAAQHGGSSVFDSVNGPLTFVIGGRVFGATNVLSDGVLLLAVLLILGLYLRRNESTLWIDESELATCPHCLSEIPAAARVCAECTRDVATA